MNITAKELNADHFGQVITIRTIGEIGFDELNLAPVTIQGILTGIHSTAEYVADERLCSLENSLQPTRAWVEVELANPMRNTEPETYTVRLETNTPITIQEEQ